MTDTLHRRGRAEELKKDFVIFAHTARGINHEGSGPKIRRFLEIIAAHEPVNLGDISQNVMHEKKHAQGMSQVSDELMERKTESPKAVFTNIKTVMDAVDEIRRAELGVSINLTGPDKEVNQACHEIGLSRHSVEHSLGILGRRERLPQKDVLEISCLCGHGMVSFNAVRKVMENVKLGRLTVEEGARYLTVPCVCGSFNPERAKMILERARKLG